MTSHITVKQRHAIFKATCDLLQLLSRSMDKKDDPVNLTSQLYRRIVAASMACPGFTPIMKDSISWLGNLSERDERFHGQPRFAESWRHQYGLSPKPGMSVEVIDVSWP